MPNPFYYINVDVTCDQDKKKNFIQIDYIFDKFPTENSIMFEAKKAIMKNIEYEYSDLTQLEKTIMTQKTFNDYFYDMD